MRRLHLILLFSLLVISIGFIACEDESSPTGPTPTAPQELTTSAISDNSITISWKNDDNNVAGYRIFRAESNGGFIRKSQLSDVETLTYTDFDLSEGTMYQYKVKSYFGDVESDFSNSASVTTLPKPPSDLVIERVTETELRLSWSENSSVEDGYEIQSRLDSVDDFTLLTTLTSDIDEYNDTDLQINTTFHYRIRAIMGETASEWSNTASGFTKSNTPLKPENLTAEARSGNRVILQWQDTSDNEIGFVVEMKPSNTETWSIIDSLRYDTQSEQIDNLETSTEYNFRIYAYNNFGNSDFSSIATVVTEPGPPLAPSNFNADTPDFTHTILTWIDQSVNENGFTIEKKETHESRFAWVEIASLEHDISEYRDYDVTPRSSYDYRIASFNDFGNSPWVTINGVQISDGPPVAPSDLSAQGISTTEIHLNWNDNSTKELGFIVEFHGINSGDWMFADSVEINNPNLTVGMLEPETEYLFRVCAYNEDGNSDFSSETEGHTFPLPPAAPSDLSGSALTYSRVELAWTDNSDNEENFIVQRRLTENPNWIIAGNALANTQQYNDAGIAPSCTYLYRVCAQNVGGASEFSNEITVIIPEGPPPAPTNLNASALGTDRIRLTWIDNSANETEFQIERRLEGGGNFAHISSTAQDENQYEDVGLQMETTYEYRIRAVDAINGWESGYSNIASATTDGNQELINEGFEDYQVGGPPPRNSGWEVILGGQGTVTVSDQQSRNGRHSIRLNDPAGSTDNFVVLAKHHRPAVRTRTRFSVYFAEWGEIFCIRGGDDRGNIAWELMFREFADWSIRDGEEWRGWGSSGVRLGNWFEFEIISRVDTGTYDVWINGFNAEENCRFAPGQRNAIDHIVFVCYAAMDNHDSPWENAFIDDIVIEEEDADGFITKTSYSSEKGMSVYSTTGRNEFGPER